MASTDTKLQLGWAPAHEGQGAKTKLPIHGGVGEVKDHNFLRISVYYSRRAGSGEYWLSLQSCQIETRSGGYDSETSWLMSGKRYRLETVARFNKKQLLAWVKTVDGWMSRRDGEGWTLAKMLQREEGWKFAHEFTNSQAEAGMFTNNPLKDGYIRVAFFPASGFPEVRDIPNNLDGYYRLLDCDCIDCTKIRPEEPLEIVCDDNGMLAADATPNPIQQWDTRRRPPIFGSYCVVPSRPNGEWGSIHGADLDLLKWKMPREAEDREPVTA